MTKTKSKRYNVYIEEKVHDKAVKIAAKTQRGFSYLVNQLLKNFFEEQKGR